ncbi:MAG: hypothetical protein AVDCRST_MAG54-1790, partial [uncultured Actinomycetospora sp.]
ARPALRHAGGACAGPRRRRGLDPRVARGRAAPHRPARLDARAVRPVARRDGRRAGAPTALLL